MAITGVLRPGHVQLKVLNLNESVDFYKNVLSLIETGRDDQGRVYFKAWDEREHSTVTLRESDKAGLDFFSFKVANQQTLDKLEQDLNEYGVETSRIPKGELLETGERVRFQIPTGHTIELFCDKTIVGNTVGILNPESWSPESEKGIAPIRMDHILLYGPDIEKAQAIFQDVLGFYLVEHVVMEDETTDLAIWLSCSMKAHDIAFVRHEEPGKLHHIAFCMESWDKVLRAADLMSMNRVDIDIGPTRHGIIRGTTIYAFDPSGNRFETYAGGYQAYPDWEPITWTMSDIGRGIFYHDRELNERFLSVLT